LKSRLAPTVRAASWFVVVALLAGCADGDESAKVTTAPPITALRAAGTGDYASPDLALRVAALIREVEAAPTADAETLKTRAWVLWEWANAYALAGNPIWPDLPAIIGRISGAPADTPWSIQAQQIAAQVDRWVAELAFREAHPRALGQLASPNTGPFPVGSRQTLVQTYTLGEAEMAPGSGFLVTLYAYGSPMRFQATDPRGEGYTTIGSSNADVAFELDELPVSGMFSGTLFGTDVPRPFFRVAKGTLKPGDVVTVTVGDTSSGAPALRLPSPSSSGHRARIWVRLAADGPLFPMAEIPFVTQGLATRGVRGFAPSIVAVGEPVPVSVRSEDEFRNRATSAIPVYHVTSRGSEIARLEDRTVAIQTFETAFDAEGVYVLSITSEDGRITGETNPILVERAPARRIYWGETHGHSGFAEGIGTVDAYYRFAREDARFDFATLSEHDIWMDDLEWETLRDATIRFEAPGVFETFLGHEWTVAAGPGGHHNVLFRTPENRRRADRQRAPRLDDLYAVLARENAAEDVVVIPHAHQPGNWWRSDARFEPLVEIVSNHGAFEWLGRRYLESGFRLGFIGGSDDHIGHPGLRALNDQVVGSDGPGGQAAVIAPALSRDGIFDALKSRSTYATNGHRIVLDVAVNGHTMGQEAPPSATREIRVRAIGTGPIDRIAIVRNGSDLHVEDYAVAAAPGATRFVELRLWSETDPFARRAQSRGFRTWQGTLTVRGAGIVGVSTPDTENVYTEGARLSEKDPGVVEFSIRTRGHDRSLVLELDRVTHDTTFTLESTSPFRTESGTVDDPISHEFAVSAMTDGSATLLRQMGPHRDSVQLRLISPPTQRDRELTFVDTSGADGDAYWVRVLTRDGGAAWSSPIWVGPRPRADAHAGSG